MITTHHEIHFQTGNRSRKTLIEGAALPEEKPLGQLPRITKLMALAVRLDGLIQAGHVQDQAELARLAHVTRARLTQIMNLRLLAPDIQESLLFLPPILHGRAPVLLRDLQPLASINDWQQQRKYIATHFGDVLATK